MTETRSDAVREALAGVANKATRRILVMPRWGSNHAIDPDHVQEIISEEIRAALQSAPAREKLQTRPVAFRVKNCRGQWSLFMYEEAAQAYAESHEVDYQGLYVREAGEGAWSDEQRHTVAHAQYMVDHATDESPEVCFDYQLVKTLLELVATPSPVTPAGEKCNFCKGVGEIGGTGGADACPACGGFGYKPVTPAGGEVEGLADAIDAARFQSPDYPRERPRAFADADRSDREYSLRLARAAIAHLARLSQYPREEWRTMESAPKDGTEVDLWCRAPGLSAGMNRVPDCWYSDGKWWRYDEEYGGDQCRSRVSNTTHWMPLPSPPADNSAVKAESETSTS